MVIDTSGPLKVYGTVQLAAMKAAAAYVNRNGGISGHKVQVISLDDNGDPATAASVLTDYLSGHPKPGMIFPGTGGTDAIGLLPVIKRNNLLAIGTADPASECSTAAATECPTTFIPYVSDSVFMAIAASWFKQHHYTKVGILAEADPLTQGELPPFESAMKARGIQYSIATFPATSVDVQPQVSQLQSDGVQALFGEGLGPAAGYIGQGRAKLALQSKLPIVYGPGASSEDLTKLMPTSALANSYELVFGVDDPSQDWPARAALINDAKPLGGVTSDPINLAAFPWTDLILARDAAEQAKSIDASAMADALNNMSVKAQTDPLYLTGKRIRFTTDNHGNVDASGQDYVIIPVGPLVQGVVAKP